MKTHPTVPAANHDQYWEDHDRYSSLVDKGVWKTPIHYDTVDFMWRKKQYLICQEAHLFEIPYALSRPKHLHTKPYPS